MNFPRILQERLAACERSGRFREVAPRCGLDFCSNDYLGFASDADLRNRVLECLESFPLGATGSRLLRGQLEIFDEVEGILADFCGRDSAVLFPSGYQANIALLTSILQPGDLVFSDERNHASLIDGARLSRAERRIYPHGDARSLRIALDADRDAKGLKVIVTESLFSMDGDIAPLQELANLAVEHEALLIVDEAHATGLWGSFERSSGGGIAQSLGLASQVFASIHTGGKALGCGGAWISCDANLKRYLINFARPLIFSTAPMPLLAVALREAIRHWKEVGPERAIDVHAKAELLAACIRTAANGRGQVLPASGPILPVVLGSSGRCVRISRRLLEFGFDVRAIRPPTVPEGSARLRLTVRWGMGRQCLQELGEALRKALEEEREEAG